MIIFFYKNNARLDSIANHEYTKNINNINIEHKNIEIIDDHEEAKNA